MHSRLSKPDKYPHQDKKRGGGAEIKREEKKKKIR
jgi:hypothetical protein